MEIVYGNSYIVYGNRFLVYGNSQGTSSNVLDRGALYSIRK
jgi:hypothetical protein